jgi:NitT/TauT family transport system substrate-binding protein
VLAVRAEAIDAQGPALHSLVAALFHARRDWLEDPAAMAPLLAPRLRLPAAEVVRAFEGMQLPDLAANLDWLGGRTPALTQTARRVAAVMQRAGLLARDIDLLATTTGVAGHALTDPRYLPATS